MGKDTKIEWTNSTWNPIRAILKVETAERHKPVLGWHCEHISEGCRNCYAESMNRRLGTGLDFKPGHRADVEIFLDETMLLAPLRWKKPRHIFVNSMTDTFAEFVKDEWLDRMFAVMALCGQHTFQVLTKRPERMRQYMEHVEREAYWMNEVANLFEIDCSLLDRCYPIMGQREPWVPLPNVWLGISAEDQATFEERRQHLRDTPAAVRFFSLEPLLGPIDLGPALATGCYHWTICGGESGPHARPMHPQWCRDIRDQCAAANVPYFFKQWGEWEIDSGRPGAMPENGSRNTWIGKNGKTYNPSAPTGQDCWAMRRVGKRAAGRLLDGQTHNGMPS